MFLLLPACWFPSDDDDDDDDADDACVLDCDDDSGAVVQDDTGDAEDTAEPEDTGEAEPGCITVDGKGDFATIAEAIEAAEAGSLVSVCAGEYEEHLVIEREIDLVGEGPETEIRAGSITVETSNVTISDFSLTGGSETAVVVEGLDVVLERLTIDDYGEWGVHGTAPDGLTIVSCSFSRLGAGGIWFDGASGSVTDSEFESLSGYGIRATEDASILVKTSVFEGIEAASDEGGIAIFADESPLEIEDVRVASAALVGVYAYLSPFSASEIEVADTPYGVVATDDSGEAAFLEAIDVTGATMQGVYVVSAGSTRVVDVTVQLDAAESCDVPYDEFGDDGYWCGGLFVVAPQIEASDILVSGYESYSALLSSGDEGGVLSLGGSSFTDGGRWGLLVWGVTASVSDVTVSAMREVERDDPCAYVDRSGAFYISGGETTLERVEASDNVGWGIVNLRGSVVANDLTLDGNGCSGFVGYEAASTLSGAVVTNPSAKGAVADYYGTLAISSGSFAGGHATSVTEYESDGVEYRYEFDGYGVDVVLYETTDATIVGSLFTDGDIAVSAHASVLDLSLSVVEDYEGSAVAASDSTVELAECDFDDVAGVLYATTTDTAVLESHVGTTHALTTAYRVYADGVLTTEGESESGRAVLYAYGSDGVGTLVVEGALIDQAYAGAVYAYAAEVTIGDLRVSDAGSDDAIIVTDAAASVSDSDLRGSDGSGVYLDGASAALTDTTLTEHARYGIECVDSTFTGSGVDLDGNTLGESSGCD